MNKLVIVGNGFDLAHGLPTSYKHFIDDFWKNLRDNFNDDKIKELVFIDSKYTGLIEGDIGNFDDFLYNLKEESERYSYRIDKTDYTVRSTDGYGEVGIRFMFENEFFKEINVKNLIKNWVDFENEYYLKLKRILKRRDSHYKGSQEEFEKEQYEKNKIAVEKHNKEFLQIIELFEKYLAKSTFEKYDLEKPPINSSSLLDTFQIKFNNLSKDPYSRHRYQLEFLEIDQEALLKFDALVNTSVSRENINQKTLFLNFNNTATVSKYISLMNGRHDVKYYGNAEQIQIHGELFKEDNPVNFGFGDEMDEDYQFIENLNDNKFLEYFKSFKYLQNSNYKKLLDLIDSEKFQVYIMGHSCGLSDRTLLNAIFEHENCRSIKVFYHQKEDGSDNFTEIIQNISRHFNDKKVMRSKIVNKSLCAPLPQDIRFQEKTNS